MYDASNRPGSNYNKRLIYMWIKQAPPTFQNSEAWIDDSPMYMYNTFLGMTSGNSVFYMTPVKYFSVAGRRPCPPLNYVMS